MTGKLWVAALVALERRYLCGRRGRSTGLTSRPGSKGSRGSATAVLRPNKIFSLSHQAEGLGTQFPASGLGSREDAGPKCQIISSVAHRSSDHQPPGPCQI